jgi:hypothetical protein
MVTRTAHRIREAVNLKVRDWYQAMRLIVPLVHGGRTVAGTAVSGRKVDIVTPFGVKDP